MCGVPRPWSLVLSTSPKQVGVILTCGGLRRCCEEKKIPSTSTLEHFDLIFVGHTKAGILNVKHQVLLCLWDL